MNSKLWIAAQYVNAIEMNMKDPIKVIIAPVHPVSGH
jgi:hypothetical protein